MLESIINFFQKYYIQPILQDEGYNIFNTATWALLAILSLYGFYKLFKKLNYEINITTLYAALPLILFGALTRSFVDHNFYTMTLLKKILFITPGIWFFCAGLFFAYFIIGYNVYRKYNISIWKTTALLGTLAVIIQVALVINKLGFRRGFGALLVILILGALLLLIYKISKHFNLSAFLDKICFAAVAGQMWDATNTAVILTFYGGTEKHVVPKWLISNFGPWSFFAVKLALILSAVYLIYKKVEDKMLRNVFLLGIAILGLGEGMRNFISMILATPV